MRKFLTLLLAAVILGPRVGTLRAAPARSYEARQLKKQHKAQRKDLKQQQRAMKKVMAQHEMSGDQRQRFKNDLKVQKRMLHKSQKNDSRRLKQSQKVAKASHATSS
jgi:ABC-type transport system involved in cytochrome bd biosynthesis fused ATPase/permease subunit